MELVPPPPKKDTFVEEHCTAPSLAAPLAIWWLQHAASPISRPTSGGSFATICVVSGQNHARAWPQRPQQKGEVLAARWTRHGELTAT